MEDQVKNVLDTLDPENDDQWTESGLPKLDVVSQLAGFKKAITRKELTDIAPQFTRDALRDSRGEELNDDESPQEDATEEVQVVDLPTRIKGLDDEINQLVFERDKISKEIDALALERDNLQEAQFSANTANADMEAKLAVIKQANQARYDRAMRARALREQLGTGIKDIDPRSPLDRSFTKQAPENLRKQPGTAHLTQKRD